MSGNITVIGSLNMDLVVHAPKVPIMGETILGSGFMTAPGGKGANQAVAAARLGGEVFMIGCVGNDMYGKDLLHNLKENNVIIDHIKVEDSTSTGVAVIMIKDGDNCIIVDPAANSLLTPEMIDASEEIIKNSSIIVVQLEIPLETVVRAILLAKKHGVKVLLNPAPARKIDDELLAQVDVLTPNETECEIITGITINNAEDAKRAVEFLNGKGVPHVIITMGGNGVVYNSLDGIQHKTAPTVKVVDTTAAGDSFTGAIALALSQGKTIEEAIDFANIVGPLTVTKEGAQTSLPTMEDVYNYIINHS
jgi:ribokinase